MRGGKIVFVGLFLGLSPLNVVLAQNKAGVNVNLSGDFVSSYVWRGFKQAGASVQPCLSVEAAGFSLGAWASTDIAGNGNKEVDFSLSYSFDRFTVSVTDYWWDGEFAEHYFSYPDRETENMGHLLEAGIAYTISESFPFCVSWNTFLLGRGNKKPENGNNSFSIYVELCYPFSISGMHLNLSAGFTPWKSAVYGADIDGFKFTNIGLKASREIRLNDRFGIPVFANVIANPAKEDIHFVFGLTIK